MGFISWLAKNEDIKNKPKKGNKESEEENNKSKGEIIKLKEIKEILENIDEVKIKLVEEINF